MELLDQLFSEAVGENVLYHMTETKLAKEILRKNVFKLIPWIHHIERSFIKKNKREDINQNKFWFASFARHPVEIFGRSASVIFVIDQDKLKQKYKIIPFSYNSSIGKLPFNFEFEEKLISNYPYIKNFNSYIKEIYVDQSVYGKENEINANQITTVNEINNIAKENNIPIYFILSNKNITQDNRSLKRYLKKDRTEPYQIEPNEYKYKPINSDSKSNRLAKFKKQLKMLTDLIMWREDEIKKDIYSYERFNRYDRQDLFWYLDHEVLGNRKHDPQIRVLIPKIIDLLKITNTKNNKELETYFQFKEQEFDTKLYYLKKSLGESKENNLPIEFYNTTTGFHHGQIDGTLYIYNPESENKDVYGNLTWAKYDEKVYIYGIEIKEDYRRFGLATKLFNRLKIEFPDHKIIHTNPTKDGENWIKSLKESVDDDVLFHVTKPILLYNILKTNTMILNRQFGFADQMNKHKDYYYLSTARNKLGSYFVSKNKFPCNIVLDRNKLKYNYKIISFNYDKVGDDVDTLKKWKTYDKRDFELEDRIISKKPYINDISKYIKRIELIPENTENINKILSIAKERNIDVYLRKSNGRFEKWDGVLLNVGEENGWGYKLMSSSRNNQLKIQIKSFLFHYIILKSNSAEEIIKNFNKRNIVIDNGINLFTNNFGIFIDRFMGFEPMFFHGLHKFKLMFYEMCKICNSDKWYIINKCALKKLEDLGLIKNAE